MKMVNQYIQRSKSDMTGIGVTWKDLKHAQLMDDRQREEQKRWDQEFARRKTDLEKQRQICSQRRSRNTARLADISARWRSLERKRIEKSEFYLERLRTSLSLAAVRQEAMSSGSPAISLPERIDR